MMMHKTVTVSADILTHNNPYGYKINLNNPFASYMWRKYKEKNNLSMAMYPGDKHRLAFEKVMLDMIDKGWIKIVNTKGRKNNV